MILTRKLVRVAALIAASGCGGATATTAGPSDGAADAVPPEDAVPPMIDTGTYVPMDTGIDIPQDAAPDTSCFGPCCNPNAPPPSQVSAGEACQLLEEVPYIGQVVYGPTCAKICGSAYECLLPNDYFAQVQALNPDGGVLSSDGSPGQTLDCPATFSTVTVTCIVNCTGRLTEGYSAPGRAPRHDGERFAAMAYLEAVSVHAFRRLERELAAHGAPPELLRGARRARRDEVRHTATTSRLARARGRSPRLPAAPPRETVRSLFAIALENAVEGCVRETYGAVAGLVEAQTSAEASLRVAMRGIAVDECRHAELAWAVHSWALPRLSEDERRSIERAMKEAVAEIRARDPRAAALLFTAAGTAVA
jgi:hypothetical protein